MQERDQRAERGPACNEGARAVDRVQHPPILGILVLKAKLLTQHAGAGASGGQDGAHFLFRAAVRYGDGAFIRLALRGDLRAEIPSDDGTGSIRRCQRRV
jgi:hypothetical protein